MVITSLRLPQELHAALKKIAEKEHRSLHAQIIYILEKFIEEYLNKQG